MVRERSDEKIAFEVVRRVLGVRVEEYDVNGRQKAVDALLHYSEGRVAALEVSSLGPPDEARITNVLDAAKWQRSANGLRNSWTVTVPRDFHPADLTKIDQAIQRCEQLGATELHYSLTDNLVRELFIQGVQARSHEPSDGDQPKVWVLLPALGGFVSSAPKDLPIEIAAALETDKMQSKLDKLAATGMDELHLFLHIRETAFSFPVYNCLAFGGLLPTGAVGLPYGLTQLWLLSGWKAGGVVRAIANEGWSRVDPFD